MAIDEQAIPRAFCWTRYGPEAGEPIEAILGRKETERLANGGVFYWGIGNSVGPGIEELLRRGRRPEVLFSPIMSKPREGDVAPSSIVAWSSGETSDGFRFALPRGVRVTSRADRASTSPRYALVCASAESLEMSDFGSLRFRTLRNLRSGNPLGASQVTAVVERGGDTPVGGPEYTVTLRAALVPPYAVRLRDPVVVSPGSPAGFDEGDLQAA